MPDPPRDSRVHIENIERLRCPRHVKRALLKWADGVSEVLGGNLLGMYAHGSLPRGCFHPRTSDVDVLVVTADPCSEAAIGGILKAHGDSGIPVDATFASRSQVEVDETPTSVDFVMKPAGDRKIFRLPEGQSDFLLQRQDVWECDSALVGPSARQVVPEVPWAALARCLDGLYPHIVPRFKNPALMLCRTVYAFANRRLCSKQAAGQWAVGALREEWRPLLVEALRKYASGLPDNRGPDEPLRAFERYCARCIASARRPR